jgi:heme/copper-type cytochrome/quinol oxidase subunit 2
MIIFIILACILPSVFADIKIQLGEPYVNLEDFSNIKFSSHSDQYDICLSDQTVIPVLIKNRNDFSDTFSFTIDKEYVSIPVKSAVIGKGKSAVLPLIVNPSSIVDGILQLDIVTKEERIKRSVMIKTNIEQCRSFSLNFEKTKDELCGCDKPSYNLVIENEGTQLDVFELKVDAPDWVNITFINDTIEIGPDQGEIVELDLSVPCDQKGIYTINLEAVSSITGVRKEANLELGVSSQEECYNTQITAKDVKINYLGGSFPIKISNNGIKDLIYSLSLDGIDWYELSQTDFSLKSNEEKIINLALYPGEDVVEGDYSVDIRLNSGGDDMLEPFNIRLQKKSTIYDKIAFYLNYSKYYILSAVILFVIILLLVMFFRQRKKNNPNVSKNDKTKSDLKKKELKDKKQEKKVVEKKVADKKEKKKLSFVEYGYLGIVILLFLGIIGYIGYKFYKPSLTGIKLAGSFLAANYIYVISGLVGLLVLFAVIYLIVKMVKKRRKKNKKFNKKFLKVLSLILLLLVLAGGIYSLFYFNLFQYIIDFVLVYYPYILMGMGILIILILILHFHTKKIQ